MGKFRETLGRIFADDTARYDFLLPDEAVSNPEVFEKLSAGSTPDTVPIHDDHSSYAGHLILSEHADTGMEGSNE